MLKFAFLLLFLLNSLQISTASDECGLQCIANLGYRNYMKAKATLPRKEQKKLNASVDYIDSILEEKDQHEKFIHRLNFEKLKLQGAKLYAANEKMNALDGIPLNSGWVRKSHVELCPQFHDLQSNNFSERSIYNYTFLNQYHTFDRALSKIRDSDLDVKKLNDFFYYFSDEKRQVKVAQEVHELSQRLQCLQSIKSLDNKEFIDKMTDLYEAFCYSNKFTHDENARKYAMTVTTTEQPKTEQPKTYYEPTSSGISYFWIFVILIGVIAFCGCVCYAANNANIAPE